MRKNLTEVIKMLKSFQIENFNSIKDPIIFSMEPVPDLTEHMDFITHLDNKNELLKVASIYGPNASGKSNLLYALRYLRNLITGLYINDNQRFVSSSREFAPFEFTSEKDNLIKISTVFARSGKDYWYTVTTEMIDFEPIRLKIVEENFSIRNTGDSDYTKIFSRNQNTIDAEKITKALGTNKLNISNTMTLLLHLYLNYIDIEVEGQKPVIEDPYLQSVVDLFEEITSITFLNNQSFTSSRVFRLRGGLIEDNKAFIIKSLQRLDIHISDIIVKDLGKRDVQVYCVHQINGLSYELRLEQESQGTSLLIYLLSMIASRRNKPTIFLIDELDSHLHPKLVSEIISLFNSELNQYNQLIFNSHDMWNMVPEQFRRDQVWFTYRNDDLATELISLSDIVNYKGERIRKDAKYSKQYMEGKYGADPFIRKGLDWHVSE